MKKNSILIFFLLFGFYVSAQKASLKGVTIDTSDNIRLVNTAIALLKAKDSTLCRFTRSKEGGSFEIDNLDTGKYILMITRNRYADYFDALSFTPGEKKNIGNVMLTTEANLLADVEVRTKIAAMRMKGDTLEYAADSFHVREGASVEDLLKILPGMQVDKDGNITSQGEKVEKILVDGEEFFSDDPTVATQNLQADAVKSVQVFDKKSDQAEFTGIDDGSKTKTINLKLKEDKKNGYFGKIDVGAGSDDRWSNSAMVNRFEGKKKLSAYGIMSSTGKKGLNWDESSSYGESGGSVEYNDDFGGFVFMGDGDEFSGGTYYGSGVPKAWAAGLNFGNKYNDDKQSLNGSYRFNKLTTAGTGNSLSQSLLPDSLFYNTETSNSFNNRWRHSLSGIYEQQFDSSFSMKLTVKGYLGGQNTFSNYDNQSLDEDKALVNESWRRTSQEGNNANLNANLLLRKKFKKTGRTLSLNINDIYNGSNTDGFLYSLNSFYNKGVFLNQDTTDQAKKNNSGTNIFNSKITYTEPIAKDWFAEISYAFRLSTSNTEQLSYNKNDVGKYLALDTLYSTRYDFDVTTNTGGLALKYNGRKVTMGAGTDVAFTNFNQKDLLKDSLLDRNYKNFFPKANFTYKFNQTTRLNLSYNGSSQQPSITQISPVADNTNPLIIRTGNPFLKQQFVHRVNLNFNNYKVLTSRSIYIYGSASVTNNAIVTNQATSKEGITTYSYVNSNGNYNTYAGGGYYKKFSKADFGANLGFGYSASRYNNFVNGVKNKTDNYAPGLDWGFNKQKDKKFTINYRGGFNYNISTSTINESLKTKYWTQSHNLDFTVYFLKKFELNNNVDADLREKTAIFTTNNNVVVWSAYLARKLLKKDKGFLKFYVYDLLNQNKGYSRTISTNVLTERNYQTIQRYFLLSFVWNFSKTASGMPSPQP
ncbi:outer membrane beta-barrel protein [Parafilimonas sp.]|uniref:outer membrane beta-barrel protein n=1 Tax=Parafilimonas sp. TaxID=1969739 RepID=UPI0039E4844D